jgi:hypothetical protein
MPQCKKKCETDVSFCNEKTGRCNKIKISKKKSPSKPGEKACKNTCPVGSECNRQTGRCNKKKVVSKPGEKTCRKTCPDGSECNRQTGRCKKSPAKVKSPASDMIYHPFYKRYVKISSDENCGKSRASISRYGDPKLQQFCDLLPLKNIKYILGPINYSEYNYNGKNICIFGEKHTFKKMPKCPYSSTNTVYFHNFLQTVLNTNKDTFYDFFIETQYKNYRNPYVADVYSENFFLYHLYNVFRGCLLLEKSCPYNNLRAHYLDTRGSIMPFFRDIVNEIYASKSKTAGKDKITIDEFKRLVITAIKSDPILRKELDKSSLGKEIENFAISEINNHKPSVFTDDFLFLSMFVMDIYTLARIFRKFARVPYNNFPIDVSNVIIYVGDHHALNYEKFMENYLGIKPIIKTRKPGMGFNCLNTNQCLSISGFKRKSALFS